MDGQAYTWQEYMEWYGDDALRRWNVSDASQLAVNAYGEAQPAAAICEGCQHEAYAEPLPVAAVDEGTPHEEAREPMSNVGCCRAQCTMSDDELSTARQLSDASSEEQQEQINCRFTNAFTGETYFTKALKVDTTMSIGFLFYTVKSELGDCAFHLQVGKQVWQASDVYGKFWLCQSVSDALGASEANEVIVQVIKLTRKKTENFLACSKRFVLDEK